MAEIRRPVRREKSAWWVTGRKKDGKMALLGPFFDTDEADSKMFDGFPNDTGEKHYLNTVDRARATQMLKYKLFSDGNDLDTSMQPFSHIK